MRSLRWLASVVAALAVLGSARAQSAVTWGTGGNAQVVNQAFKVQNLAAPAPIHMDQQSSNFKLFQLFRNVSPLSNSRTIGYSIFPSKKEMPGKAYLEAFGYTRVR
jgi:hypothetical protein